jgi:hypothetical protein
MAPIGQPIGRNGACRRSVCFGARAAARTRKVGPCRDRHQQVIGAPYSSCRQVAAQLGNWSPIGFSRSAGPAAVALCFAKRAVGSGTGGPYLYTCALWGFIAFGRMDAVVHARTGQAVVNAIALLRFLLAGHDRRRRPNSVVTAVTLPWRG